MNIELTEKQTQLLKCESQQILYGGAMAGGKSFAARALAIIYATHISGLQIYLFRRHSQEIINNYFTMADGDFPDLLSDHIKSGFCTISMNPPTIKFTNNSAIHTHHMQDNKALSSIQGTEIGFCICEESTQLSEEQIRFIRSRVRMTKSPQMLKEMDALSQLIGAKVTLPRLLFLTNPGGLSADFHKRLFINPAPPGIEHIDLDSKLTTYYLKAKLSDNPHLDQQQYKDQLKGLGNPELVKAYLDGDWSAIIEGAVFEDCWDEQYNVIKPFKIPSNWQIARAMDWGNSPDPSTIAWFATSNGEDVTTEDDNIIYSRPGDIFLIFEYDTADINGKGIGVAASELAKIIVKIDNNMPNKVDTNNSVIDSQCMAVVNGPSIYDEMKKEGCIFKPCSKGPGSRAAGLMKFREYLGNAKINNGPSLRIFNTCRNIITQLPTVPRSKTDPTDADSNCKQSHYYDAIRYFLNKKEHRTINTGNVIGLV